MQNEHTGDTINEITTDAAELNGNVDQTPPVPYEGDSTSVLEIQIVMDEDQGKALGDPDLHHETEQFINIASNDPQKKPNENLETGLSLAYSPDADGFKMCKPCRA